MTQERCNKLIYLDPLENIILPLFSQEGKRLGFWTNMLQHGGDLQERPSTAAGAELRYPKPNVESTYVCFKALLKIQPGFWTSCEKIH